MTKIDKVDIENINLITSEIKISNLTKIKIKKGDYEIELSSESLNSQQSKTSQFIETEVKTTDEKNIPKEINEENIIKSPMVGVAYLSADPNSPPYIKIGQHVKAGDTLLLIEAMKTFNEIKAPKSGVIKKIVALNSQPVEFGDHLVVFE